MWKEFKRTSWILAGKERIVNIKNEDVSSRYSPFYW